MTTPVDMPVWTGTISHGSILRQRAAGNQCLLKEGQSLSFRNDLPHKLPNPKWSALDAHTYEQN